MDKLQWFKFAPSDWMMGKIQRCNEVTQARFMRLCCLYWNKECNLNIEDSIVEIDKKHFDILIEKKIISKNDEHIFIDFLDEQMVEILKTSSKRKKAANARWSKRNASALQVDASALQNDAEKIREEKKRGDNIRFRDSYLDSVLPDALSKNLNVSKEKVIELFKDFSSTNYLEPLTEEENTEARKHFANWLKIQLNNIVEDVIIKDGRILNYKRS